MSLTTTSRTLLSQEILPKAFSCEPAEAVRDIFEAIPFLVQAVLRGKMKDVIVWDMDDQHHDPLKEVSPSDPSEDCQAPVEQQGDVHTPQILGDPHKKREEALRLLKAVDSEAKQLEDVGTMILKAGRLTRDVASPLYILIDSVPADKIPTEHLDRVIDQFTGWSQQLGGIRPILTDIRTISAASFNVATTGTSVFSEFIVGSFPSSSTQRDVIEGAHRNLSNALQSSHLVPAVRSSMGRLGLTTRQGDAKPAIKLLEDSTAAIECPIVGEGGAVPVLISLRECIDAVIEELLKQRLEQEPTKGRANKIVSIGNKCGLTRLDSPHFARLGNEAERLAKDLSNTKQANLTRDQLQALYNRGLVFLKALLESIDENRLRKPPN